MKNTIPKFIRNHPIELEDPADNNIPIMKSGIAILDPICVIGTNACLSFKNPYPVLSCTAWPVSWAATESAAIEVPLYISGDKFIVFLTGS